MLDKHIDIDSGIIIDTNTVHYYYNFSAKSMVLPHDHNTAGTNKIGVESVVGINSDTNIESVFRVVYTYIYSNVTSCSGTLPLTLVLNILSTSYATLI